MQRTTYGRFLILLKIIVHEAEDERRLVQADVLASDMASQIGRWKHLSYGCFAE